MANKVQKVNLDNLNQEIQFLWLEINMDAEEIDIDDFLNEDGILDSNAMLDQIKEDLNSCYQETLQWQSTAILDSFPTN